MIRIAICDDEKQQIERANDLLKQYIFEHPQYQMEIHCFSAPIELLTYVNRHGRFDVLLLDIYMDGILGTDVARELRAEGDACQIIFLTTSRDHAVDAFSLNAAHYLVKPYSETSFFSAMDKVMNTMKHKEVANITVKSKDGFCRIDLNHFVYAETVNHDQKIHLLDGRIISVRKSSTELFELIEKESRFYKCGSTYILNMDYIVELTSKNIAFSTGTSIPTLSRKYMELKKKYMDYSCSC